MAQSYRASPVDLGAYLTLAFEELFDFFQTISVENVMKNFNALKALLLVILIQPASGFTADIEVLIRNLEAGKGKVYASLCNKNSFMKTRCGFKDKVSQIIFRQPIPQIRWQKKRLIAICLHKFTHRMIRPDLLRR